MADDKPIKILCLHGMGTSASIFRTQTTALRSRLPANYTFDFIDGAYRVPPAPGTNLIFDSEHYGWWTHPPTVDGIRASHERMLSHIASHGPYDMVMGFSQGCSLISSFLLYHAREQPPNTPLPFKAAIFVCGGVPFPVLADLGVTVPLRAHEINDATSRMMNDRAGQLAELARDLDRIQPGVGLWDDTTGLLHEPRGKLPDRHDVFGLDYTVMPPDLRIGIPTAHVYGAKDPRWPASVQLAYFCDEEKRVLYDHGGGHEIPRSTEVSERFVELFAWLREQIEKGE